MSLQRAILWAVAAATLSWAVPASAQQAPPPGETVTEDPPIPTAIRRSRVIEFDARLIQGQRPRAGAVYLFQRAPRRLPDLIRLRPRLLDKIVEPVLGPDWKRHR